jgi:tetratricopeptide (TPR) repeat protein
MKRNILYLYILLFVLTVTACQSIQPLTIDYLVPGRVNFPPQLKRVGIVNNVSESDEGEGVPVIATESLAESIAEANYFNEVIICDSVLRKGDLVVRESGLSRREVNRLVEELGVDFILALENLEIEALYSIRYLPETGNMYGAMNVKVSPTVAIYLPNHNQPISKLSLADSIFWDAEGGDEADVHSHMISNKQMIEEASRFSGTIPAEYLLPNWQTAERYLYGDGSTQMRDGAFLAQKEEWEDACKCWQAALDNSKSKKLQMKASHNMALYYEMKDDLEQAIAWESKAQKLAAEIEKGKSTHLTNYVLSVIYLQELETRLNNLSVLKAQMDRFIEK